MTGTIDIVETEKLKLDPNLRSGRVRVVFAKFHTYKPVLSTMQQLRWPVVNYRGDAAYKITTLLVIGYYNDTGQFDRHLDEFTRFLAQVSFPEGA